MHNATVIAPNTIRTVDHVDLFYRDWGTGRPVLFVAGWSLTSDSWNYQMLALHAAGYRVVAFDRRSHGRSSDPGKGYDFDTLAGDIAAVMEALDLKDVTLVGHSMGCNEIVRCLARHGSRRVARIALLGPMTPYLRQADDNPHGIPLDVFDTFRLQRLTSDFPLWIDENIGPFVTPETPSGMRNWLTNMALATSALALGEMHRHLVRTDFRADVAAIDVPVLLIAGTNDASAPLPLTALPTKALLPHADLRVYEGAPHGMFITHMARVNADLLEFAAGSGQNDAN